MWKLNEGAIVYGENWYGVLKQAWEAADGFVTVPCQWEHLGQLIKCNQHAGSQAGGWNAIHFLLISTRNKES